MRFLLPALLLLAACGSDTTPSYDTYQECFDDVTDNGGRETVPAIVECCTRRAIDGELPACGDVEADCINYLTANLSQFDAGIATQIEACEMVVDMLGGGGGDDE